MGYIFVLTKQTEEVQYIFYDIALALQKARDFNMILLRYRIAYDGSVTVMKIFDPLEIKANTATPNEQAPDAASAGM
jgi:hypothetical protein